jgi:DNA replication and repair protein RecF
VIDLHVINYRSYSDATFHLKHHTVIVGPNGSGKTNLLEAIRTLSIAKSYRASQDREAIKWDETYCRIIATGDIDLEYVLQVEGAQVRKVMKHDGVGITLTEAYGLLPTVLFAPETLQLAEGGPQERRRFLDTVLSQASRDYLEAHLMYRKVLRERHFVLLRLQQGLGSPDELHFWDQQLIEHGMVIVRGREAFIAAVNTSVAEIYPLLRSESKPQTFTVQCKQSLTEETFRDKLQKQQRYDMLTGVTHAGPHRDDVLLLLDDRDIHLYASRGELRSCILALKLAEAEYLKATRDRMPLLLLDDVFSELDAEHREHLMSSIGDYDVVITTTDDAFLGSWADQTHRIETQTEKSHGKP